MVTGTNERVRTSQADNRYERVRMSQFKRTGVSGLVNRMGTTNESSLAKNGYKQVKRSEQV